MKTNSLRELCNSQDFVAKFDCHPYLIISVLTSYCNLYKDEGIYISELENELINSMKINVSRPTILKIMRRLAEIGVVVNNKEVSRGRRIYYKLSKKYII